MTPVSGLQMWIRRRSLHCALPLGFALGCSNGAPPPLLDAGGPGSSATGADATRGPETGATGTDAATGAGNVDASFPVAITYVPKGCSYEVTPAATLGYVGVAFDNDSAAGPLATATPIRVRVGLGGNTSSTSKGYPDPTTSAVFTWETGAPNTAAKVKIGMAPTALTTLQTGYVFGLPATQLGSAAYFHEVHVCGLEPATTYYYVVGGGAPGQEVWSAVQSFTTVPATGAVTVAISGDARDTVGTWQLLNERLLSRDVSAHLFTGDIVLVGGNESEYETWLDAISPGDAGAPTGAQALGQLMFVPVAGNHEEEAPLFFANFAVPGSGPYAKTFGSYTIGNAHFLFIDDAHISAVGASSIDPEASAQVAWIEQDLAAANLDRANHPFIFALSHRGMFSTSNHQSDTDVLETRASLSPIYAKYNVDAVFNGHDHEYERTYPIVPGSDLTGPPTVVSGSTHGTVYVICAGAGAAPYDVSPSPVTWRAHQIPFGVAAPSGSLEASYVGIYLTLTLTPKSAAAPATATVNVYPLLPGGGDTVAIDSFTLTR